MTVKFSIVKVIRIDSVLNFTLVYSELCLFLSFDYGRASRLHLTEFENKALILQLGVPPSPH